MGYGLLCSLWVLCRRPSHGPCCPLMSNPSTSPRTAWPDISQRWNNRIAAQHLPRDLWCGQATDYNNHSKKNLWLARKYAYANDLPIIYADGNWQIVEGVLSKDMATVGEYLQTWKLKLSTKKAVLAVFHLNNKEAKSELKVNFNNETCHFAPNPNTSEQSWTGNSHIVDTLSHFAKRWHHALYSWGGLLALAGVLEQQRCE